MDSATENVETTDGVGDKPDWNWDEEDEAKFEAKLTGPDLTTSAEQEIVPDVKAQPQFDQATTDSSEESPDMPPIEPTSSASIKDEIDKSSSTEEDGENESDDSSSTILTVTSPSGSHLTNEKDLEKSSEESKLADETPNNDPNAAKVQAESTPDKTTTDETAPDETTAGEVSPDKDAADKAGPDLSDPDQSAPDADDATNKPSTSIASQEMTSSGGDNSPESANEIASVLLIPKLKASLLPKSPKGKAKSKGPRKPRRGKQNEAKEPAVQQEESKALESDSIQEKETPVVEDSISNASANEASKTGVPVETSSAEEAAPMALVLEPDGLNAPVDSATPADPDAPGSDAPVTGPAGPEDSASAPSTTDKIKPDLKNIDEAAPGSMPGEFPKEEAVKDPAAKDATQVKSDETEAKEGPISTGNSSQEARDKPENPAPEVNNTDKEDAKEKADIAPAEAQSEPVDGHAADSKASKGVVQDKAIENEKQTEVTNDNEGSKVEGAAEVNNEADSKPSEIEVHPDEAKSEETSKSAEFEASTNKVKESESDEAEAPGEENKNEERPKALVAASSGKEETLPEDGKKEPATEDVAPKEDYKDTADLPSNPPDAAAEEDTGVTEEGQTVAPEPVIEDTPAVANPLETIPLAEILPKDDTPTIQDTIVEEPTASAQAEGRLSPAGEKKKRSSKRISRQSKELVLADDTRPPRKRRESNSSLFSNRNLKTPDSAKDRPKRSRRDSELSKYSKSSAKSAINDAAPETEASGTAVEDTMALVLHAPPSSKAPRRRRTERDEVVHPAGRPKFLPKAVVSETSVPLWINTNKYKDQDMPSTSRLTPTKEHSSRHRTPEEKQASRARREERKKRDEERTPEERDARRAKRAEKRASREIQAVSSEETKRPRDKGKTRNRSPPDDDRDVIPAVKFTNAAVTGLKRLLKV